MWVLCLLGIVIALVIDYIIAKKFSDIAEMKGHEGNTYFWFTFIFGLIGMLMVIALPDTKAITIKNLPDKQVPLAPEVVAAVPVATKGDPNKSNAPISAELKDGKKVCPKCGTAQKIDRRVCWSCGQPFDN